MRKGGSARRRWRRAVSAAAAACAALTDASPAQTSGTWAADFPGFWSGPANWVNGSIPGGGGTATFGALPTFRTSPNRVTLNLTNVTLDSLVFDSPFIYQVARLDGTTPGQITLTGAARIAALRPGAASHGTLLSGHIISAPVAGTAGVNVVGPGVVSLIDVNTYTGDTTVSGGGTLRPASEASLGAPAGIVHLNDGTLRTFAPTSPYLATRNYHFAGAGTIHTSPSGPSAFGAATFGGAGLSGAGTFTKAGPADVNLIVANALSGHVHVGAGTLALRLDGSLADASGFTLRGTLVLDGGSVSLANRIGDAAPLTFLGGTLRQSAVPVDMTEVFGATSFAGGLSLVEVQGRLVSSSVSRTRGAAANFTGPALGGSLSNNARVFFTAPPPLIGGGGAAGSTNVSIIPWASGDWRSLVTYGKYGVRPLNVDAEYAPAIPAGVSTANVRLVGAHSLDAPATVNALLMEGTLGGTGTLRVTSGAVLAPFHGNVINANVDFGAAEAVLHTPANPAGGAAGSLRVHGAIGGTGGLTKTGAGFVVLTSTASTYTGPTIISAGEMAFSASVPASGAGPLGADTSPVVLTPAGRTGAALRYSRDEGIVPASFDRDLHVTGSAELNNPAAAARFGAAGSGSLTMNGDIVLDAPLYLTGSHGIVVNGTISGPGMLTSDTSFGDPVELRGDNTYTGGTELSTRRWRVGSDSAFGAGSILVTGNAATISAVGGPRVVPNDVHRFVTSQHYWTVAGDQDITFTGGINLSATGNAFVAESYAHEINNTALTTYAGVVHSGGLTKVGPGTLVLSGDNTYGGATTVSSGVLRVTHARALGSPLIGTTVDNTGVLEIANDATSDEPVTIAGPYFGSTGTIRSTGGDNRLGHVAVRSGATIGVDAGSSLTVGNVDRAEGLGYGTFAKAGGGSLSARRFRVGAILVQGGDARVAPGRDATKTSSIGSLEIAPNTRLDLGDNDLVRDYVGDPYGFAFQQTRQQIASAYAGGAWTGGGLTSSLADASRYALGYAESSDLFTSFPATFSGVTVDGTAVLVMYTRYGDANLDGVVNLQDFNRLAANFGATGEATRWSQGDFNYDATINLQDFNRLAANFGLGAAGPDVTPADWAALASAVPEPGCGVASLIGAALLRRARARVARDDRALPGGRIPFRRRP